MTTDLTQQAQLRRDRQITEAHASDVLRKVPKPPVVPVATLLAPAPAAATMYSLDQIKAIKVRANMDAVPALTANDPQAYLALFNLGFDHQNNMVEPSGLLASVAGTTVNLTWTNNAKSADAIDIYRDGAVVGTVAATVNGYADNNVPAGSHTWTVQARNQFYPTEFSQPATATVGGVVPSGGWSDLSLPPGGIAIYVSSSGGTDQNPGTSAGQPLKTILAGYSKLRDGSADQLLLKCGDTWNEGITWSKASGDATKKMVFGSYGVGPRPKLRVNGTAIYGGKQNKLGLLIVDLDLAPVTRGQGTNGICFFAPWSNVRVEGVSVQGFAVNCVVQEIDANRSAGMEFFRCAMFNAEGGAGHNQNLFMGSCDNMVIDGCAFDRAGRTDISSAPDLFKQNAYLHQSCGPSVFKNNVTCRASASGVQQRSGGVMTNNLAIQNPVNLFQGDQSAVPNTYSFNVCVDSLDIGPSDPRGFGHWCNGTAGSTITNNIVAHQDHGTANCEGFQLEGINGGTVSGNFAYDWHCPTVAWGHCYSFENTSVNFTGNRSAQPRGGVAISGINGGTNSNNTDNAQGGPVYDLHIEAYMTAKGKPGGLEGFIQGCLANCKQNWDAVFTADGFNSWARGLTGVAGPVNP